MTKVTKTLLIYPNEAAAPTPITLTFFFHKSLPKVHPTNRNLIPHVLALSFYVFWYFLILFMQKYHSIIYICELVHFNSKCFESCAKVNKINQGVIRLNFIIFRLRNIFPT